jgi:bla regulator protein BlaR1
MNVPFNQLIDQSLVQKIGLTLLHSLWQGLILAILAGLILLLTRKVNSGLRYWLFVGLIGLFTIGVGITFYLQVDQNAGLPVSENRILSNSSQQVIRSASKPEQVGSFLTNGVTFFTQHSSTIVLIWLLVLAIKSVQFVTNLYQLNYLKRSQTFPIGQHWENRMKALAGQLRITRTIRIIQSGLVRTPVVLGHFKPVILIPLGLITAIPPEELEMMLLHELAHIKRLDFMVNLLQHLLELLFFFNPALLWVSSLIRAEREACCDDLVLLHAGSKRKYIHALLSFREYQLEESNYSLAFANKSGLLQRVERLVSKKNTTLNLSEKVVLSIAVLLICTISLLYAQPVLKPQKPSFSGPNKTAGSAKKELKPSGSPVLPAKKEVHVPEEKEHQAKTDQETEAADRALPIDQLNEIVRADSDQSGSYVVEELQPLQSLQGLSGSLAPIDSVPELYKRPELKLSRVSYPPNTRLTLHKFERNESISDRIADEIVNAGLSPTKDNLSFHITNDLLIVNGVRQSDEVHQKIISKFVKKPGDTLDFTYQNTRK